MRSTTADWDKIAQMFLDGTPLKTLCEKYNVSESSIRKYAKLINSTEKNTKYTETFKKNIIRMKIEKGLEYKDLSERYHIAYGTLKTWESEYERIVINELKAEIIKKDKNRGWYQATSGAGYYR